MTLRALVAVLLVALGLPAQAPPLSARLAAVEAVVAAQYRGEPLEVARAKSNAAIAAFNASIQNAQAELDAAKAVLDAHPARVAQSGLRAQLRAVDAALRTVPDGNDKAGNARYQAQVQERKVLMKQINDLVEQESQAVEAFNAQVRRSQEVQARQRAEVRVGREAVDRRKAAYDAFAKGGGDVAFFTEVNRLLVAARQAGDAAALARVRALRRELGAWAMAEEDRSPRGLIILEARLGEEPVWLVLDTGATDVVLAPEVLEGAGISLAPGEDNTFVVVGGQQLRGRAVRLPRLAVAEQVQTDVFATAVRPFQVGVDGLLGQSFLKGFVYTVDEGRPEKLVLVRRP
jgi:clan AA aspartic protease (TIGR02281 family)